MNFPVHSEPATNSDQLIQMNLLNLKRYQMREKLKIHQNQACYLVHSEQARYRSCLVRSE